MAAYGAPSNSEERTLNSLSSEEDLYALLEEVEPTSNTEQVVLEERAMELMHLMEMPLTPYPDAYLDAGRSSSSGSVRQRMALGKRVDHRAAVASSLRRFMMQFQGWHQSPPRQQAQAVSETARSSNNDRQSPSNQLYSEGATETAQPGDEPDSPTDDASKFDQE